MKENDIVFARTGASVGKTYLYDKKDGCLYYAGFLIRANIRKGNPYFVFSETKRNKFIKWVKLMSARSGQPGINSKQYASYSFFAPNQEEQDKISLVFKLVDQRISVQRKIIEDIRLLESWIRDFFFSNWKAGFASLETFYSFGKAGGTPKTTEKNYYDGDIPFLSISDMTREGKYIYETEKHISEVGIRNSSAWLVPKGSLIISMYASVGLPAINQVPLATSQAMFSMIINNEETTEYVYQYILFFKRKKLSSLLETGTQSNINADEIRKIQIPLFDKSSKHFLKSINTIEKSESFLTSEIKCLVKLKNYLLSNLFC
jgi:type I restriction enzyme S subunit